MSKYGDFSGPYFNVFGMNTGKYGPEKSPYLDTFHAVLIKFIYVYVFMHWSWQSYCFVLLCFEIKWWEQGPLMLLWCLTHFQPVFHFYATWKHQKTEGFLIFSGSIEVNIGWNWVNIYFLPAIKLFFLFWNIFTTCYASSKQ